MTALALPRNSPPPPPQVAALTRALARQRRAIERNAVAELPKGSTLADHERARSEGLKRLTRAQLVLLSSLEAPKGPAELAARAAARLTAMAEAGAQERTEQAQLGVRERLARANDLLCARPWQEVSAPSRQQTNYASALAWARSDKNAEPPAGVSLTLLAEAGKVAETLRQQRRARFQLREVLYRKSLQPRLQKCGSVILDTAENVTISVGQHGAHFTGLMSCGLVWSCPVCAPKISRVRQGMVDQLLRRHLQRPSDAESDELPSGGALFMTFTVSHSWGDALKETRVGVGNLHRKLWAGRAGKALKKQWGVIGHVRSLEVTHGMNGWHPHLHCVILTEGQLTDADGEQLRAALAERWCTLASRAKLDALEEQQHGELLHSPEDAARYLAKFGAAVELTGWTNKQGRQGGRTPFQILSDYQREGRTHDLQLWRTWERDIKGARFLTWSRGLQERYAILEKTDEEIIAAEECPSVPLVVMNKQALQSIARNPSVRAALLDTAERHGGMATAELMASLPVLLEGARILVVFDSAALDKHRDSSRTAPEGGLTLRNGFTDCILYETQLLPDARSPAIAQTSDAR